MICKKCGRALPNEGLICTSCGAMMDEKQIKEKNTMSNPNSSFQTNLLSDRYGVDKQSIYEKDDRPKENKVMGILIIAIIVLFLIVMAIIINIGR